MKFEKLIGIEKILGQSHNDPGSGGKPIQSLYEGIVDRNPQLSKHEAKGTFLNFVEYLLKQDMVQLYGAYDKKNDHEEKWEGSIEEIMSKLRNFVENLSPKKLEETSVYFYEFNYCFLVWKVEWTEVLKRFNLEEGSNE
ncbi:MAG: hypothetical protein RIC35_17425 [Marinoscillum sp.]